jgi:hypothetical protein
MTDLRKYSSQTLVRLAVGALLILFIVGLGLIAWVYGLAAALMGFLCLLGAMLPVGLIWLFLGGLDWVVKKLDKD